MVGSVVAVVYEWLVMNKGKDTHETKVEEALEGLGGNDETQRIIHTHSIHIAHKRLLLNSIIIAFYLSSTHLQLYLFSTPFSRFEMCFYKEQLPLSNAFTAWRIIVEMPGHDRQNTSNFIMFVQILEYIQVGKGCRKLQAFSLSTTVSNQNSGFTVQCSEDGHQQPSCSQAQSQCLTHHEYHE